MARQTQINVSAETKQQADEFMNVVGSMFETIEVLAGSNRPMTDGEWLIIANQFKKLTELRGQTERTIIYVEAERTHRRGRVIPTKTLTKAEKLQDPEYMSCPACKKVMKKRYYAEKHKKTSICSHILAVGNIAAHNKAVDKTDKRRVIISSKPIVAFERKLEKDSNLSIKRKIIEKKVETDSIAHRVIILEEIYKPKKYENSFEDEDGTIYIEMPIEKRMRDEAGILINEERQAGKIIVPLFHSVRDIGKWEQTKDNKWRTPTPSIKIKIKKPTTKPKLKLVLKEPEFDRCDNAPECGCCWDSAIDERD
jgi:hypothetical protein